MGVGLVYAGDGEPFDFSGLAKVELPEGAEQTFLDFWIYPASGYQDYADLYLQTADELHRENVLTEDLEENKKLIDARMAETMLPYENQLRALFGMEETDHLTANLSEYPVDIPDDRDWSDLFPDEDMNNGTDNGLGEDDLTESPAPGQDDGGDAPETSQPSESASEETSDSTTETEEAAS